MGENCRTTVDDCRMIALPHIENVEGNLTPVYDSETVPFPIARVYYLYDIPGGASRGGHGHRELRQLIIAAMGSFDVVVDDGHSRKRVHLNRSYNGLLVPPLIWRELDNFSSGANCLVICSLRYNELDYIRNYQEFLKIRSEMSGATNPAGDIAEG